MMVKNENFKKEKKIFLKERKDIEELKRRFMKTRKE